MNSPRNSQENSPRASLSDSPEIIAITEEFQYPESLPAAAESERIRANDEEDTEQQPGPSTRSNQNRVNFAKMRGVRKFESWEPVARYGSRSQTPRLLESPTQPPILTKEQKHQLIAESSRRSRRDQTPTRETKLDQVRSSIKRYQRGSTADNRRVTRSESKSKQTISNINVIEIGKTRANFFHHRGDILNSRRSFAHCISSNMKMSKGLTWQIVKYYPEMLQSQEFAQKPPIGSVISFYDTNLNRYIFNLVTKENYYYKPTYYNLSVGLHTLRFVILKHNIRSINLPKFGCGLDQLSEKSVLRQIIEVFSVPVEIHLYNYNTATN